MKKKSIVFFKKRFNIPELYENIAKLTLTDAGGEIHEYKVEFGIFVTEAD
jgi:hypothetical protein